MTDTSINTLGNNYRRNFNWRISHGKSLERAEAVGMAYLATGDYPEILEDLLFLSRRRKRNRTALAKLQLQILAELGNQEQAIKHYKAKLNIEGEHREYCEAEIFRYRMIGNALRIIGDGIAWRALKYDRIVPRVLSEHPVKHVVAESGTSAEIQEFLEINRGVNIPILNAITNCLAVGDITTVDPNDGVEIVEVKSSNTSDRRKTRQKIKLKETVQFLDEGGGPRQGRNVFIDRLPISPTHYLSNLEALLERCEVEGWASAMVGSHLFIECVDLGHPKSFEEEVSKIERRQNELLAGWEVDQVTEMDSLQILTFAPNLAPFSVYPFRDKLCIDLMIGSKYFRSILNLSAVARQFEQAGWKVDSYASSALEATNNESVMVASKEGFLCHFPPSDFAKMQFEMLSPSTLIEECDLIRERGSDKKGQFAVWTYAGEADQWK